MSLRLLIDPVRRYSVFGVGLMVICLTGCAHSDAWTSQDTRLQATLYIAMAADAYTTRNIQYDPNIEEVGPIAKHVLGSQPSTASTWQYFLSEGIMHYFIVRALPAEWRPWYQGVWIADHTSAAIINGDRGLFHREDLACQTCLPER